MGKKHKQMKGIPEKVTASNSAARPKHEVKRCFFFLHSLKEKKGGQSPNGIFFWGCFYSEITPQFNSTTLAGCKQIDVTVDPWQQQSPQGKR